MTNNCYQLMFLSKTLTQRKLNYFFNYFEFQNLNGKMGSTQSKDDKQKEEKKMKSPRKNPKQNQVSSRTSSSAESDSVSYSTETNSSNSGRSTTNSDISHYPDSLGYH